MNPTTPPAKDADNTETAQAPDLPIRALVVDDEFANRDFMVRLLQQTKMEVLGAGTGKKALELVEEHGTTIILILLDQRLPDTSGVELLKQLRPKLPEAKIMMATMHDEPSMMRDAFAEHCTGFLVKPHGFMELFKRIRDVKQDREVLKSLDNLIFDQHGPRTWRG